MEFPSFNGAGDVILAALKYALFLAVAITSFRRSLLLSRYPIWRSVVIGVIAGMFWVVWLIVSWVNRERIAGEWTAYRQEREQRVSQPS